jgi:hypothetical protein
MGDWHLSTSLVTAQKLRALEPARLAVGHGPVLDGPLAAMDKAIAKAEKKVGSLELPQATTSRV